MEALSLRGLTSRLGPAPFSSIDAGTPVRKGHYFATQAWSITVARDGEVLGGRPGEKYLRVPLIVALALAPLVGALFLACLPVIGICVAVRAALAASRGVTGSGRGSRVARTDADAGTDACQVIVLAERRKSLADRDRRGGGGSGMLPRCYTSPDKTAGR